MRLENTKLDVSGKLRATRRVLCSEPIIFGTSAARDALKHQSWT